MPAPKTFAINTPLPLVRRHLTFTRRELRAHPLTAPLAPPFDALLSTWGKIFEGDFDLQDQVDEALSEQRAIDSDLNTIARRLWKEINLLTGDDSDSPLRKFYFGNKQLHLFIRPILAGQLAAMRLWVDALAKSDAKTLNAIGMDLAPLLPKADAAVAAEGQARKLLDEFRKLGERKAFIDDVNTKRKEAYTAVSLLPQKHPELTTAFVEGMFRRDRSRDEDTTIAGLEEEIQEIEVLLADRKKLLAQLQKEQQDAAAEQKQIEAAEKKKKLAQLQLDLENKQKEAAALAAELENI